MRVMVMVGVLGVIASARAEAKPPKMPALGGLTRQSPCEVVLSRASDDEQTKRLDAIRARLPAGSTIELDPLGAFAERLVVPATVDVAGLVHAHPDVFGIVDLGRVDPIRADGSALAITDRSIDAMPPVRVFTRAVDGGIEVRIQRGGPTVSLCTVPLPDAHDSRFASAIEGQPLGYSDQRGRPQDGGTAHARAVFSARLEPRELERTADRVRLAMVVHLRVRGDGGTWSFYLDAVTARIIDVVPDFRT